MIFWKIVFYTLAEWAQAHSQVLALTNKERAQWSTGVGDYWQEKNHFNHPKIGTELGKKKNWMEMIKKWKIWRKKLRR